MSNTDQELRDEATQIIESVIDWAESGRTTVGRSNAIEPQVAVDILIKLITTKFIPLSEHNRKVIEARMDESTPNASDDNEHVRAHVPQRNHINGTDYDKGWNDCWNAFWIARYERVEKLRAQLKQQLTNKGE